MQFLITKKTERKQRRCFYKCNPKEMVLDIRFTQLTSKNAIFMGHKIFTGPVVLVWRVQAQVAYFASIKARKSLNLHQSKFLLM